MLRVPPLLASTLAATGLLGAPLHASTTAQSHQASAALGLARSSVGDLQVAGRVGEPLLVVLDVPGSSLVLDLAPHSVRSEGFVVRAQLEDGSWIDLPHEPVRTYQGTVAGVAGSRVAASMLEDGLHARIQVADGEELWIEPLAPHVPLASASRHVLYGTADVLDRGWTCGADRVARFSRLTVAAGTAGGAASEGGPVSAEIACDADFEYFSAHGAGTQARIESVINSVNLQYAAQVGISHSIATILIRTSSNDPYTRKPADQLLAEFRNEWNTNQAGVARDVAHLFTGRDLSGTTIGIAYLGTVCNVGLAYGLVQSDFDGNFACVTDLSAHELGHNWGANHCSCPGFTMNASITCANTFHPTATIPDILAYRDGQSCFGAPPATGSVAGTVTRSSDGTPIGGALVQTDGGQSDTTAGNGSYSIAGVPTGQRTVTASAPGFQAEATMASVSESQTTTVDFALDAAPVGSQAVVECITYSSSGGQNGDRNLFIAVLITDDGGSPVAGASVSVAVDLNGAPFGTATATTDSAGQVTFQAKNSPNGCYETDVTAVGAAGLIFDGTEPANGFTKGSDTSPDPDCRTGSDGCGAG